MMSILDKVTYELEPTRTYSRRLLEWIPSNVPGEGHLIISQWKGRRAGSILERDLYQIVETQEPVGRMGRSFLWLNVSDSGQDDVYRVVIGPGLPTCTCTAAKCKVPGYVDFSGCKHRDATRKLMDEGEL